MFNSQKKTGFTLIELLIVIAIIGILAVAFLPSIFGAPEKARDTQRIADLKKISDFLTYHYSAGTSGLTLPNGWICIKLDGADAISTFINTNLSSIGGVFPTGPRTDWSPYYGLTNDWCDGGYGYGGQAVGLNASYKFVLFSKVEIPSNGNSTSAIAITPGNPNVYYTILVQK